jgi:opacity protein-like surface antigen
MERVERIRVAAVAAVLVFLLTGAAAAQAQTLKTEATSSMNLKPTDKCPQPDIDQLQRVITFVQGQSWSEHPGSKAFLLNPDTAACRVVLKINKVSSGEQAALEKGGEGRLSIQKTKDYAKPSRLPLLLWVVFGGAGVVFVFIRYGRR